MDSVQGGRKVKSEMEQSVFILLSPLSFSLLFSVTCERINMFNFRMIALNSLGLFGSEIIHCPYIVRKYASLRDEENIWKFDEFRICRQYLFDTYVSSFLGDLLF